jgi:antitoxin (DNA-binding transcriptional repressor) of toxin-antitoxin stability system
MGMTASIEEVQKNLREIVATLHRGDEMIILENGHPIAKVISFSETIMPARRPGSAKNITFTMAPDFDATPEGFEDYVP